MYNTILGVNSLAYTYHHDNWAFLFYWDKYVWISSERLDRIKQSSWIKIKNVKWKKIWYDFDMWEAAINYCLDYFNLNIEDVDLLVYIEWNDYEIKKKYSCIKEIVQVKNHHYIHACSSFFSSGFEEAAILTIDWQWKKTDKHWKDFMVMQAMFYWEKKLINTLHETYWKGRRQIWIGSLYQMITRLLWLSSEWSTMWLSSYWKENNTIFNWKSFFTKYKNDVYLNNYFIDWVIDNKLKYLDNNILLEKLKIDSNILFEWNIYEGYSADLAFKSQADTENIILELVNDLYKKTKSKNLCIWWWVWLNSIVNNLILEKTPFENIYIVPWTDDSWLAFGCALYWKYLIKKDKIPFLLKNPFFWKKYSNWEITSSIKKYEKYFYNVEKYERSVLYKKIATLISKWNILWCFFGKSEFGPRALWHRSIIWDPRYLKNRDKLNDIKWREKWRPIAPSILDDFKSEYFDIKISSDFMLLISKVKENMKKYIPAVVHVDWTARLQTVTKDNSKEFFYILNEFNKLTWVPVIMNSSFNFYWESIIETPEDAIKWFLSSNLDYLILEDYIISKKAIFDKFKFKKPIILEDILNNRSKIFIKKEEFLKNKNIC